MQKSEEGHIKTLKGAFEAMTALKNSITAPRDLERAGGVPKFKKPRTFNRKATSVTPFLQEVQNTVFLSHQSLLSKKDKCVYLSTYLGNGSPKDWYNSVEKQQGELLYSFPSLIKNFTKHFGDSNVTGTTKN
jgi:hypothetical protein